MSCLFNEEEIKFLSLDQEKDPLHNTTLSIISLFRKEPLKGKKRKSIYFFLKLNSEKEDMADPDVVLYLNEVAALSERIKQQLLFFELHPDLVDKQAYLIESLLEAKAELSSMVNRIEKDEKTAEKKER